jgi:hypothetical protein
MGDVLQFKHKYIPVIAFCEPCQWARIQPIREEQFKKYLEGKKSLCPYCGQTTLMYERES